MSIRIEGLSFSYGSTPVLNDVSIQAACPGEILGLVGSSLVLVLSDSKACHRQQRCGDCNDD